MRHNHIQGYCIPRESNYFGLTVDCNGCLVKWNILFQCQQRKSSSLSSCHPPAYHHHHHEVVEYFETDEAAAWPWPCWSNPVWSGTSGRQAQSARQPAVQGARLLAAASPETGSWRSLSSPTGDHKLRIEQYICYYTARASSLLVLS